MASLSGSDFYAYCLRTFKRTDKETEFYEAVTDVIMDLKLRYNFEDFKTEDATVQIASLGDYKVSLPSSFGHLIGDVVFLDITGGSKPLNKLTKEQFDYKYPGQNETTPDTGVPKDYCIFGGELLLGPVPDSADYYYQFSHTTEAQTQIVSGTTAVPFTDKYRWVLRSLVLAELYFSLGNDEEGIKWQEKGNNGIEAMIRNELGNVDASVNLEFNDL